CAPCRRPVAMVASPWHPWVRRVLVRHGEKQRLDEQAERQPPQSLHGRVPAPRVTEASATRLVRGLEGRGNPGLAHRRGPLHVCLPAVCLLFGTPHTSRRAARRPPGVPAALGPATSSGAQALGGLMVRLLGCHGPSHLHVWRLWRAPPRPPGRPTAPPPGP